MKSVTTASLQKMKQDGEKITALTAYDASFAKLFDSLGVDILLIGDSLGMVLKGEKDTLAVTTDEIAYHVKCVSAGVTRSFIMADMPFMTYDTPEKACANAALLMAAGANMVKLEGGAWLAPTVQRLTENGVPVCGHLGLTPQSVHVFGGFKVQGREADKAQTLLDNALALEAAGAQIILLECVPAPLAKRVTEACAVPVIGIGAGNVTDAQILVMHDMLGVSANYMPKFSKNYLASAASLQDAVTQYINEVKSGTFPGPEHTFTE